MDFKEIRRLKIFEVIEKSPAPSQREIAKSLNISLGLVNAFIRQSADRGYVTIRSTGKNRFQYHLTSKGIAEKKRLNQAFLRYGYGFFKEAKAKIQTLFQSLEKKNVHRVVFFGAGELAEIAYLSIKDTCMEMVAVVDDRKIGENFSGMTIRETGCLNELVFDRILLTTERVGEKLNDSLIEQQIPRSKVVRLV